MSTTVERPASGRGHWDMRELASAPERSREQRLAALDRANDVRVKRAEVKRRLKRRQVNPVDVLREPPVELRTMKIFDFLLALPKVGRVKATKTLTIAKVAPSKTVAGVSDGQRAQLIRLVSAGEPYQLPDEPRVAARPKPSRPRRVPRTHCQRCRTRLYVATAEGLCGFCKDRP